MKGDDRKARMPHTQGPWKYDDEGQYIFGPNTEMIAEIRGYGEYLPQEANGRLIAAAPELLEALESCLSTIQMECPECDGCKADLCTQCRAKAAIRKAKGE